MEYDDEWTRQQLGTGCYLCPPQLLTKRDLRKIASLSVSDLYLLADQRFLGHSALIFSAGHATRLDLLTDDEYARFAYDLRRSVGSISRALHPDHMNIASMGNSCPHLHWGIAPRYRHDPYWGRSIWAGRTVEPPAPSRSFTETDYGKLIAKIRTELK